MTRTMKNVSTVNNSICTCASNSTKTVSIEAFNIEMNAKNKAYHFILSHGLFDHFSEFCKNVSAKDPHAECVNILASQAMFKSKKQTKRTN